ncbi:hypothetical protein BDZ89DRAFT_1052512 [Hymenopellis radicata]|nr:hypothetical protein BDZ89DRAFT_1052512 [Hymenopellis radicata]
MVILNVLHSRSPMRSRWVRMNSATSFACWSYPDVDPATQNGSDRTSDVAFLPPTTTTDYGVIAILSLSAAPTLFLIYGYGYEKQGYDAVGMYSLVKTPTDIDADRTGAVYGTRTDELSLMRPTLRRLLRGSAQDARRRQRQPSPTNMSDLLLWPPISLWAPKTCLINVQTETASLDARRRQWRLYYDDGLPADIATMHSRRTTATNLCSLNLPGTTLTATSPHEDAHHHMDETGPPMFSEDAANPATRMTSMTGVTRQDRVKPSPGCRGQYLDHNEDEYPTMTRMMPDYDEDDARL